MAMSWTALLWFVAIVASIPLVLWAVKRTQLIGAQAGGGTAQLVAALPLSASQRVLTVEVGRGNERVWLVLGVTPSSITTLHTMAAPAPTPATVPGAMRDPACGDAATDTDAVHVPPADRGAAASPFAQVLRRLRGTPPPGADLGR